MKKKLLKVKESGSEKMAVENLKYEVGQEMGIGSKTKNKKS